MVSLRKVHKLMAQRINDSNFDVVLIHPDWHTQSPYILRYLKTQKIYYCHELLRISYEKELEFNQDVVFFKKLYENIIRKVYKHIDMTNAKSSDIILVNSLFTKQNVFKAYGKDSVVCYPGVNSDFFRPISNLTKKTVLFAGDEEQIFGEEFKKKVSDSLPKKNTIQNFIRNKNGKDKKLVELYNRALVTVCITRNEPFPVIGLNEGGYKETVLNDKTGVLISKNINEIRNAIDYFMKTPYNSSRMGKFARDYVKSKFTWEKHMKVLEETIQQ
jgi:glycosyltransferase involved in cell wall biosynthesis